MADVPHNRSTHQHSILNPKVLPCVPHQVLWLHSAHLLSHCLILSSLLWSQVPINNNWVKFAVPNGYQTLVPLGAHVTCTDASPLTIQLFASPSPYVYVKNYLCVKHDDILPTIFIQTVCLILTTTWVESKITWLPVLWSQSCPQVTRGVIHFSVSPEDHFPGAHWRDGVAVLTISHWETALFFVKLFFYWYLMKKI